MSNPWADVVPNIFTSAATALVTLAIASGINRVNKGRVSKQFPLTAYRGAGDDNWSVSNRTRRPMSGASLHISGADGSHRSIDLYGGVLYPAQPFYVGVLRNGDLVQMNWVKIGRNRPKKFFTAVARISGDGDEFPFKLDPDMAYGGGG